jgi:hypothetical protein
VAAKASAICQIVTARRVRPPRVGPRRQPTISSIAGVGSTESPRTTRIARRWGAAAVKAAIGRSSNSRSTTTTS